MGFRFIHTSDWHFGANRSMASVLNRAGYPDGYYLTRQVQTLMGIVAYAEQHKPDFVLISGDLFENSGTTVPEILAAWDILSKLAAICPVIATAGNHDELKTGEFQTAYLSALKIPNLTLVDRPTYVFLKNNIKVLAMPWTGIKDQDTFDRLLMESVQDADIVMLHECFQGSMADNGRKFPGGISVPNIPNVRYFALGDIHKKQQMNLAHAWFSGAPMQYRFDDLPDKGFLWVEADDSGDPIEKPTFVPLKSVAELKTVVRLEDIDPHSSTLYRLVCGADKVPLETPRNLIRIDPQPVRVTVEASTEEVTGSQEQWAGVAVDYAEGVDELLNEMGYGAEEIHTEQEYIRNFVQNLP